MKQTRGPQRFAFCADHIDTFNKAQRTKLQYNFMKESHNSHNLFSMYKMLKIIILKLLAIQAIIKKQKTP